MEWSQEGKMMMFQFNIPGKCVQANGLDQILTHGKKKNERKLPAGVSTRQKENTLLGVQVKHAHLWLTIIAGDVGVVRVINMIYRRRVFHITHAVVLRKASAMFAEDL